MTVRAHDLLQIEPVSLDKDMPEWARLALKIVPWVVVRRALPFDGQIPVGVRGKTRDQRFAAWLPVVGIKAHVTPSDILRNGASATLARRLEVPALAAFNLLAAMMAETQYIWGPGGSVGFELATGHPAATANSDLDIIIQAPRPIDRGQATALLEDLKEFPVRIDATLEVPQGAIALSEFARGGQMVLKTCEGPRLIEDPWGPAS